MAMMRSLSPCGNLLPCPGVPVQRLHGGRPIIAPSAGWWEDGVTFNAAAVYLTRSAANDRLIAGLLGPDALHDPRVRDGVVAAHYRARPDRDPGYRWTRSFTGLAVFTPDTGTLLARLTEPVICPDDHCAGMDYLGVEDPRVTRIDDTFYAVYCGVQDLRHDWKANLCMARSTDLRCWEKLGAVAGDINGYNNKDGVLFHETVDGKYLMLHRPMVGEMREWTMHLAAADAPEGPWYNYGEVLRATPHAACRTRWVGAGSVPIPLGDQRYLVIFHTGHYLHDGRREYDLDAAIFNFNRFDPARPASLVESRLDRIMVPETDTEVNGPYHDSVANVLFTCGTYEYQGDLYILYGGGDTFVMSAKIEMQALLDALDCASARRLALV